MNIDEIAAPIPPCYLILTDPPYGIGADTHAGKAKNGWTQYEPGGTAVHGDMFLPANASGKPTDAAGGRSA